MQVLDHRRFVGWQHFRHDALYADFAGDDFCRLSVVAGDHRHFKAPIAQRANGWLGRGLDRIANRQRAHERALHSQQDDRMTARLRTGNLVREGRDVDAAFRDEARTAHERSRAADNSADALSGNRLEAIQRQQLKPPRLGFRQQCLGEWMLAAGFG